jgi:phosphatidylethanolamine-binding protein (PEBP) family uncharacterized protein
MQADRHGLRQMNRPSSCRLEDLLATTKTIRHNQCVLPGAPHRYFFKLYALDTKPNLKTGATKADVERALKGHILGQAELMGRYGR